MKNKNTRIKIVAAVLVVECLFYVLYYVHHQKQIDVYLKSRLEVSKTKVESSIQEFEQGTEVVFKTLINNKPVLELFAQASTADTTDQKRVRAQLYQRLLPAYEDLVQFHYKQLHFHLPDNTSFLRFHRPERYGDDLSEIRYSVKRTNETLNPHSGFEEGRIINGFRYVYPLFYANRHIGSVELSNSFEAIQEHLSTRGVMHSAFFVSKQEVQSSVFPSEQINYQSSEFLDSYFVESNARKPDCFRPEHRHLILSVLKTEVHPMIEQQRDFSTFIELPDTTLLLSFVFVPDLMGRRIAFVAMCETDVVLEQIQHNYFLNMIFTMLLLPLVVVSGFLYVEKYRSQKKMIQQLTQANQDKDRFISILAHDLKSPFSSVVGMLELLDTASEEYDRDTVKQYIHVLYDSAKRSFNLLEDILTWVKAGTDKIPFHPELQPLDKVCSDVMSSLQSPADRKQVQLVNELEAGMFVKADLNMLKTILRNLLSNAIKYSRTEGTIRVYAQKQKHEVRLVVEDQGVGMDASTVETLFNPSLKASSPGTSNEQGSGLGLLLCKEFVQRHGGRLEVESELGKGSRFTVVFVA
ncbi:MAG: ATP-binding protein [Bacteroidales bacterium]